MPERNISAFNVDTETHGGYVYTAVDRWSSRVATLRQTDEIVAVLEANFPRSVRIADVGCGDGTFTVEIAQRFKPQSIRGVDPAAAAIDVARRRIPSGLSQMLSYQVGSIYDVKAENGETLAVVRGVLHHLDDVKAAIQQLARHFPAVLVLEPNGFNPVLKVIEKTSAYHREHDEKSYWPPSLNRWFEESGYKVAVQKSFSLVPYFCPTGFAKVLKSVEPVFEAVPLVREVACGSNVMLYKSR
jgi:ubiquinone/menaquinone biosynthesis C-methylase UbiE